MMGRSIGKIGAAAGGIQIRKGDFGTNYVGSRAALVRAGLVRGEQLPGPNGPRKHSAVYYDGVPASRGKAYPHDERYMKITMVGPDKFSVWVWCSREDRESKDSQLRADIDARCAAADARERAADQLASMPDSRTAYKVKVAADFEHHLEYAITLLQPTGRHGYSLDESALQQVRAIASQLRAAVQGGGVVFDRARHEQVMADLRARAGLPPERPRLRLVKGAAGAGVGR